LKVWSEPVYALTWEPSWWWPPKDNLLAAPGWQKQGWYHQTAWVYCRVGPSKGLPVDLSGSAEGCYFHGSLVYQGGKNRFEWGGEWSLWWN